MLTFYTAGCLLLSLQVSARHIQALSSKVSVIQTSSPENYFIRTHSVPHRRPVELLLIPNHPEELYSIKQTLDESQNVDSTHAVEDSLQKVTSAPTIDLKRKYYSTVKPTIQQYLREIIPGSSDQSKEALPYTITTPTHEVVERDHQYHLESEIQRKNVAQVQHIQQVVPVYQYLQQIIKPQRFLDATRQTPFVEAVNHEQPKRQSDTQSNSFYSSVDQQIIRNPEIDGNEHGAINSSIYVLQNIPAVRYNALQLNNENCNHEESGGEHLLFQSQPPKIVLKLAPRQIGVRYRNEEHTDLRHQKVLPIERNEIKFTAPFYENQQDRYQRPQYIIALMPERLVYKSPVQIKSQQEVYLEKNAIQETLSDYRKKSQTLSKTYAPHTLEQETAQEEGIHGAEPDYRQDYTGDTRLIFPQLEQQPTHYANVRYLPTLSEVSIRSNIIGPKIKLGSQAEAEYEK